jgi:hypothetical protein
MASRPAARCAVELYRRVWGRIKDRCQYIMIAYGGKGFITPDGKLHTDDPKVREAAVKALVTLTTPYKEGYVPPGVVSWNHADDNNALQADGSGLRWLDLDRARALLEQGGI